MEEKKNYDKIIIGAGLYGLYAAWVCGMKGEKVLVLEKEQDCFLRATYVNQARVHLGYHYPRSISTAHSTARYFDQFVSQYPECINSEFYQIYATSSRFSWTSAAQFEKFSRAAQIPCGKVAVDEYFKEGMCDGAFVTGEVTFDARVLSRCLMAEIMIFPNIEIKYNSPVTSIERVGDDYKIGTNKEDDYYAPFVLNATYACINEIIKMAGFEPFKIKYELCEVILCKVNDELRDIGLTVMDGPFFSIMPFGKTGLHSLTSVAFTPHETCYEELAKFKCQEQTEGKCRPGFLCNCNDCPVHPESAWDYMSKLAQKYMLDKYKFEYVKSLYSIKPILTASDVDDSRPTCIKEHSQGPTFVSVLSGKITTVYDLEEIL